MPALFFLPWVHFHDNTIIVVCHMIVLVPISTQCTIHIIAVLISVDNTWPQQVIKVKEDLPGQIPPCS